MPRHAVCLIGACLALAGPAAGQERAAADALAFTVRPSGIEGEETLDERLARRERGFRFICIGCVRAPGTVDTAPFEPIRTLNSPQLTRALGPGTDERVLPE